MCHISDVPSSSDLISRHGCGFATVISTINMAYECQFVNLPSNSIVPDLSISASAIMSLRSSLVAEIPARFEVF